MPKLRDAVLEGAMPQEIEALTLLCRVPDSTVTLAMAERLNAKGWLDVAGGNYLVTIAGRTLVELR